MHKLLERQLRRHFGAGGPPPGLEAFLEAVDATYRDADTDRALVERSLDLTSKELLARNAELRARAREQQVIFDAVPALIFTKDTENRIVRVNRAGAQVFGRAAQDLEGVSTYDLLPRDVAAALHKDDLEVIRSRAPKMGIVEAHPGGDGRLHWMRTDKVPLFDDAGAVTGVLVLSVDITAMREAEERVRASDEKYRIMVETSAEGIWQVDAKANTVYVNQVMADKMGLSREAMMGRKPFEFMPEDRRAEAGALMERLRKGERIHADFCFTRPGGSDLWVLASASPILGPDGSFQGALGMFTDITDRKQAEEGLKRSFEQLQEVDRMRSRFLNTAAHELGTPLTPIQIQIQLVRQRLEAGEAHAARRGMGIVERNVERLARLTKDMLDAARIQVGQLRLQRSPADLGPLVEQAAETYRHVCARSGVTLESTSEEGLWLEADAGRLGQVLDNLLSNASKFTPGGGRIHIGVRREGPEAVVVVSDTGIGIAPADQDRLFRPFSQVHDPMQHVQPGTGLGLYVCRGIVESHGGSITVHSEGPGKGTSFTLRLPLAGAPSAAPVAPVGAEG